MSTAGAARGRRPSWRVRHVSHRRIRIVEAITVALVRAADIGRGRRNGLLFGPLHKIANARKDRYADDNREKHTPRKRRRRYLAVLPRISACAQLDAPAALGGTCGLRGGRAADLAGADLHCGCSVVMTAWIHAPPPPRAPTYLSCRGWCCSTRSALPARLRSCHPSPIYRLMPSAT